MFFLLNRAYSVNIICIMKNVILQGCCLKEMKKILDKSVDMVLTSPPYDNLRSYNGRLDWGEHIWKGVIDLLFKVIKNGGVVVWVVGDSSIRGRETGTSFKQALYFKEVGFRLHDTMIYLKQNPIPQTHNRYEQQFEYMFVFSKGRPKTFNPILVPTKKAGIINDHKSEKQFEWNYSMRKRRSAVAIKETKFLYNAWVLPAKTGKTKLTGRHNASFPDKLVRDHIVSWSNQGDIILDPFAGSGTVGQIAKELKRGYILIEKEPSYIGIIKKKLS